MNIRTLIVGGILLAAMPGVFAQTATPLDLGDNNGWGMKGEHEPSTSWDDSTVMFQGPDTNPSLSVNKVYFNAFMTQPIGYSVNVETEASPNFAFLGTGWPGYPYIANAFLGTWKDCNKDGYVGFADNALFEYRTELLLGDESVCPRQAVAPNPGQNYKFPHNDGTWVHEFIPIGWETAAAGVEPNPMNINDTGARVWGDWGVPGAKPGNICYVSPQPRGSFHSVGAIETYYDCFANGRLHAVTDAATTTTGTTSEWNTIANAKPWGEESDASDAHVWDCSQPQAYAPGPTIIQPPAGNWIYVNTTNVSAPSNNPSVGTGGSLAGTMNETMNGLDQCYRTHENGTAGRGAFWATLPYRVGCASPVGLAPLCETDIANTVNFRKQADQPLYYRQGVSPGIGALVAPYGRWGPNDLGTSAEPSCVVTTLTCGYGFYGVWSGNSVTAASRNPVFDRDNLAPQKVTYLSFYAFVSPATTAYSLSFPSSTKSYGAEACGTHTSGQWGGWECDPAKWYVDAATGADTCRCNVTISGKATNLAPDMDVGSPYNLRDVDCYDYSVDAARDAGVSYGLLSATECT